MNPARSASSRLEKPAQGNVIKISMVHHQSCFNLEILVSKHDNEKIERRKKIKFQGKIKGGVREGWGVEFWESGKLRYEGWWRRGGCHGKKCRLYDVFGGLEYVGPILRGNKIGADCKMYGREGD